MSLDFQKLDDEELLALIKIDLQKEDLDKALVKSKYIKKPNSEAISIIAKIYAQIGLFDKAKNYYQDFLKKDKGAITERFQLGMVLHDSGDVEAAYSEWEEVLKQEPTHPPTLFYKGLTLANEGKTAEAQQTLAILLQSAPSDNLYFGRAKNLIDNISKRAADIGNNPKLAATGSEDAYKSIN